MIFWFFCAPPFSHGLWPPRFAKTQIIIGFHSLVISHARISLHGHQIHRTQLCRRDRRCRLIEEVASKVTRRMGRYKRVFYVNLAAGLICGPAHQPVSGHFAAGRNITGAWVVGARFLEYPIPFKSVSAADPDRARPAYFGASVAYSNIPLAAILAMVFCRRALFDHQGFHRAGPLLNGTSSRS